MKKIGLICLFLLTILNLKASADNAPFWTQKTVWKENGYVYAVGQAPYNDGMTDIVFAKNFKLAFDNSVKNIKRELKVKQLKGFQIINTWYDKDKMFVLGSVLDSNNQVNTAEPETDENEGITCPKANWWKETKVFVCENCGKKYLYAVGTSSDSDQTTAQDQAIAKAKNLLKEYLKVSELKSFATVGLHMEMQDERKQVWVLVCVFEDQNTPSPKASEAPSARATTESQSISIEQATTASDKINIKVRTQTPSEWWVLYEGAADPLKNVFRIGNNLYAIGHGLPDTKKYKPSQRQYWAGAERAAGDEARKNLAAALNGIIGNIKNKKDYTYFVTGNLTGAQLVKEEGIENPHKQKNPDTFFCLMVVSMEMVQKAK